MADGDVPFLYWALGAIAVVGGAVAVWPEEQRRQSNPARVPNGVKPSIIIKGDQLSFEMTNKEIVKLPPEYGIIHDPEGRQLPRCKAYFGPFETTSVPAQPSSYASYYLGRTYKPNVARIDIPRGNNWKLIGPVNQIFYRRRGKIQPVPFYHPFKRGVIPQLYKQKNCYMLDLKDGCVVDDRGFVHP
jgi:hypothetical protein